LPTKKDSLERFLAQIILRKVEISLHFTGRRYIKVAGKEKKIQKSEAGSCSYRNSLLFLQKQPSLVTETVLFS